MIRHLLTRAFLLPLLLAALWLAGLVGYVNEMPGTPSTDESTADAIVVLTGGRGRLEHGLLRLREDKAPLMFISGVGPNVSVAGLLRTARLPDTAALEPRIVLGRAATSTIGNAKETVSWLREKQFHTIRLVTASYHMPRALDEFRQAMPGLTVIPDPIFPDDFNRDNWWRHEGSLKFVLAEFHKYLGSKLRHLILSDKEA